MFLKAFLVPQLPGITKTLRVMKLTAIFILSACLQVSANGFGQSITISEKNANLETVFKKIEQQTGYFFWYKIEVMKEAKKVNIDIKNASLDDALKQCFKDQSLDYTIVNKTIVVKEKILNEVTTTEPQPPIDVQGKVVNEKGEPIAGATITVKGTKNATSTDANGHFILKGLDENATLVITGVNIETYEVKVIGRSDLATLNVKTKIIEGEGITVSVNNGYQSIPKERATGSFEKVNNQLFNQQVGTTVLDRLETIANGLYVDKKTTQSAPRFSIRGLSSINGPRSPLVVLDNFPYEGDLNNINPNDVESVTILKDAAAASIWGTKAGNGVIVITTKKAKLNQPLRIEFNTNITIGKKPDLFYYNNISPSDFIDVEQFLYDKGFFNSQISSTSRPPLSPVVELLVKKTNGSMPAADVDAKINALRSHDVRNDFNNYLYQSSVNSQNAINLRGGSENIAYLFSAGYDHNTGSLNDKYSRMNIRSENIFRLGKNVQLTAGITWTQSNTSSGHIGYNNLTTASGNLPMYTQLANDAGNPIAVTRQYRQPYIDTAGAGKLLDWNYYPLDDHNHIDNNNRIQSLLGNIGISYKIIKGLTADIKYQYERQSGDNSTIYDQESFRSRDLINYYSQLNRTTGLVTYKVPKGGILTNSNSLLQSHSIRGQLNFSRQWDKHELVAIAGSEIRQILANSSSLRTYGYNNDILSFTPIDYANTYPNFITGSTSFIPNDQAFSSTLNRYVSFYGNAAYTYMEKYSLSLSARRDASNLFGVSTNDKWTPLWSAGIGWDIAKENFYHFKPVSYLKLRATYGFSGNADPSRSGFTVLSYSISSPYTLLPTAMISQFNNPDLRWEKVGMLNLGIDFKAFANRLQGSVEYYQKKGKDLLGFSSVDYTSVPTNRITKNIASMKVHGWDIAINSINIRGPFLWTSNLNFNINKDKVTDYLLTTRSANSYLNGGINISALVGKPVYGVYTYAWAGLDPQTGDPRGYLNGQPSKDYNALLASTYPIDSLKYIGPALPVLFGSLGNTFSYKGISLTVRLAWKGGYYFMRNSINYSNLFGSRQGHGDYALRWQKPGDELNTTVPSMVYPAVSRRDQFYNNTEVLVERADHLRLQYITLDYDFKTAFKRLPFSNLVFYINMNNICIIWRANKHGIDPDYRDNSILPSRNIAFGLRANF
jgi:TonB-linked SusC/RagA family outer membrane protein